MPCRVENEDCNSISGALMSAGRSSALRGPVADRRADEKAAGM
jgi:hypothetical protein